MTTKRLLIDPQKDVGIIHLGADSIHVNIMPMDNRRKGGFQIHIDVSEIGVVKIK